VVLEEGACILCDRIDEPSDCRPRFAVDRVGLRSRDDIWTSSMNLGVYGESGNIERPGTLDDLAALVHPDEVRDVDVIETHSERINPERIVKLGVPRFDVAGDALGETERRMAAQKLAFGPFVLDLGAGALSRHGAPVPISYRGLLLLAALLKKPGESLS
jgi:hypothetical protein